MDFEDPGDQERTYHENTKRMKIFREGAFLSIEIRPYAFFLGTDWRPKRL